MSSNAEAMWRLREEARLESVRNFTRDKLADNEKTLEYLRQTGLADYIPNEIYKLEQDIGEVKHLLFNNPDAARNLNLMIKNYVYGLSDLAKAAKREFELEEKKRFELERQLEKENKNKLNLVLLDKLKTVKDSAIKNFSRAGIAKIKEKIDRGQIKDVDSLDIEFNTTISLAEEALASWKEKHLQENRESLLELRLNDALEEADKLKKENVKTEIKNKIINLKANASLVKSNDDLMKIEDEIQSEALREEQRREVVKSIYKQLQSQDFIVSKPKLVKLDDGSNYVNIVAEMPSGKRVECRLQNNGKIHYSFDNYEGMTCLKDIKKFNEDLDKIYSVKLSDERVIWSNPDEISNEEKNLPKSLSKESD